MAKKIVVRLRKGSTSGQIVANSQVISLDESFNNYVSGSVFDDNSLSGSVKSLNRSGAFIKTIIPLLEQSTTSTQNVSILSSIDFELSSEFNPEDSLIPGARIIVSARTGASGSLYRTYIPPSLDIRTVENNFSQFVETGENDYVSIDSLSENGVYYIKVSDAINTDNFAIKSILVNYTEIQKNQATSTTTTTTTIAPTPRVRCNFDLTVRSLDPTEFYERFDQYVVNVVFFDNTTCLTNYSIRKYNIFVKIKHITTTDDDIILNQKIFDINFNAGTKIQIPILVIDDGIIESEKEFAFEFFLPNDIISSIFNTTPFYTSPACTIVSNNLSERTLYPNLKWQWVGYRPDLKTREFYCVDGQALQLQVSRPIHLPPLWNSLRVIGHNGTEIVRTNAQISNGSYETFSFPTGFFTNKQAPYVASANIKCYLTSTAAGAIDYFELANINVISANVMLNKTEVLKGDYVTVSCFVKGHDVNSPVRLVLTGDTALNYAVNDIRSIDGQAGVTIEKLTDSSGYVSFNVLTTTGITSVISSIKPKLFVNYTVTGTDGELGSEYGVEITQGQTPSFSIVYSPDVNFFPLIQNEVYNRLEFYVYESQFLEYSFTIADVNYPQGREIYWRIVFLGGTGPDDFIDQVAGNFSSDIGSNKIIIKIAPDNFVENNDRFRIDFYLSPQDQQQQVKNFWSSQEFQIIDPTLENIYRLSQNKLPKIKPFFATGTDVFVNLFQVRILITQIIVNDQIVEILNSIYRNYEWTINLEFPGVYFSVEGLYFLNENNVLTEKSKILANNSKTVKSVASPSFVKINFLTNNNSTPNVYGRVRVFASDAMIVGDFYEFVLPINI